MKDFYNNSRDASGAGKGTGQNGSNGTSGSQTDTINTISSEAKTEVTAHAKIPGQSGSNSGSFSEIDSTYQPSAQPSAASTQSDSAQPNRLKNWLQSIDPRQLAPQPIHRHLQKIPLPKNRKSFALLVTGVALMGGALAFRQVIVGIDKELPNTKDVLSYVRGGSLTIKDSDGEVLLQRGPATRDQVDLKEMPETFPEAFLASEDRDFYKHDGINYIAIIRASIANLFAGEVKEGGSTITQQLSRIAFLDQERSLMRKLREAVLAQKMERELTKEQILDRYMNLVYLGSGAYGIADASWVYFSKPVDQLSLGEMAMIAGMAPAPSVYSPLVNPDLAKTRRNIVLQRMEHAGFITPGEMQQAMAESITPKPSLPKNMESVSPYFTSFVETELPKYVPKEELEAGGLTVETTVDMKLQKLAEEEIKDTLNNEGYGQGFDGAALVSIDPRSGEIKALVGGDDFQKSQFNRATQAQRQPGSTFKPFVYATAIAAGFSPYKSYVDGKYVIDGYEPNNYGKSYRGSVAMKDALTSSINVVAVKVLVDVGFEPTIEMAKRMGIKSDLLAAYALALGASEVNVLELTSAYGTFANEGEHMEAHGITRVYNRFGKVIYEAKFKPVRAIDAESAAIMTWMLESVVTGGTGGNASLPDRQVAGKTGTSEKRRDLWFIGFIPQMVTGVWLGNDDSTPTGGASSTAAAVWGDFMYKATEGTDVEKFADIPENLDDREGTIKAKPVNGNVTVSGSGGSADRSSEDEWSDPGVDDGGGGYAEDSYSGGGYADDGGGGGGGGGYYYEEPAPVDSGGGGYSEPAPVEPAPPAVEPAPAPAPAAPEPPPPISEPPPVVVPEPIQAPPKNTAP